MAAKKAADDAKEAHIRASAVLDQCLKQLKKEFNCNTLKEAAKLHRRLETEMEEAAQACEQAWTAFERLRQG